MKAGQSRAAAVHWEVDDYLSYLLARAGHIVAEQFHREVRAAGLSVLEWRVLATLSSGRPRTVGELADIVLAQQPTLTKLLDRMERNALVIRRPGATDRRQSLVRITPVGRRALGDLLMRSVRHEQRVSASLGATESRVLKGALRKLIDHSAQAAKRHAATR